MDSENLFLWQDYTKKDAALVDSWLDAEAVCKTGLDEGFDAFCRYWQKESDPEQGRFFWCRLVSENTRPFAAVAYAYAAGTVTLMELVVDPTRRGQGRGSAVIRAFVKNAAGWIARPVSAFEAVIFQSNAASQSAFYKAGFVRDETDGERWRLTADATERLFRLPADSATPASNCRIRRLEPNERRLFNAHLRLCGQKPMPLRRWNDVMKAGVRYYGLFANGQMAARVCIEKMTDRYWELSDVRTANEYRNCGFAAAICCYAANEIRSAGRIPTIRTEAANDAMLHVIRKLGFQPIENNESA